MPTGRWTRLLPAVYDTVCGIAERAGLSRMRADLVGSVTGQVVDIGAGTGLSTRHACGWC